MDARVKDITRELKRVDRKYFAKRSYDGKILICKREDFALRSPISLCFALTEDWTVRSRPLDRGICPIIHKIKYGDRGSDVLRELDEQREADERSNKMSIHNKAQEIGDEMYYQAKHAWKDVNTGLMKKKDVKYGCY